MVVTRNMKLQTICTLCRIFARNNCKDPITLSRVRKKFTLIRHNCEHCYDAATLYAYITSTGDYKDPISRIEYNNCELLRLEHILKQPPHFLKNEKETLLCKRREYFTLMGLCDVFEIEILDQIQVVRNEIEEENIHTKLRLEIIPLIIQSFENYRTVHVQRCLATLKYAVHMLQKDPIPNLNIHLRLSQILDLLSSHCAYNLSAEL